MAAALILSAPFAQAADTTPGSGSGVALGTGSSAPKAENVAIGKGAGISYSNGASSATGDIAVGAGANINNYASQGGSIAIGKNARVENMAGGAEASFALGQTKFSGSIFSSARIPEDPSKVVGSVAIGDNTFARTGSTMIGSHNYSGALGDTTVDTASTRTYALNVYETTLGANSFTNGAFATSTGAFNIISSDYNGGRLSNAVKNFGATVTGSLNSIESMSGSYYSGVASSIVGVANRTANANGSLIFGAGNEVTNSVAAIRAPSSGGDSAKELADTLRSVIRSSEGGGSTLAIGGGNTADYTQASQLIGVNNTLKGSSGSVSRYNLLDGYKNTAENVQHVSVLGSENTVKDTTGAVVVGDRRSLSGANNAVVIGSSDTTLATDKANVVSVGYKANATVEGGVALGSESVASTEAGRAGYDPGTKAASTSTDSAWLSTRGAVSIGDASQGITRQITGLAAGSLDTDAVNVAQLKAVKADATEAVAEAKKHSTVSAGKNIQVTSQANAQGGIEYTVATAEDVVFSSVAVGGVSISQSGIQAGGLKMTNVAAGEVSSSSTDAVNGSQLYQVQQGINKNAAGIGDLTHRVNDLDGQIDKVGAASAALAALHPVDFDPSHRFQMSVGLGHYKSREGVAVGAFWYPTDTGNLLMSVGYASSASDNHMVNAGLTYRFGGSQASASPQGMAEKVSALTAENRDLSARLASSSTKLEAAAARIDSLTEEIRAIKARLNMR
ncbi:YadA-like family protein [Mesosutterella sp. AGMB02718]|uniref:YadA-like family protein n=1 Tax=Mesosutterella faecium TaxID=2925194 RepID=A0ABT7IP28_9BURK|nr:YadA-like family protein [Mesosutterella sp. AGMB02718]MDL2060139.1 YadA-like family protein [Mesosutterella sp. AGMB02718]